MAHHRKLYSAVGKSLLGKYSVYAVNLISMMIMARIFEPETFGLVAAVLVFFVFFQLLVEAGLGPAIINLESLSFTDRNGIFGLTLILGFLCGLVLCLLSPFILEFYQLANIDKIVPYVAVALVFFSLSIVPSAFLQRDQEFYKIARSGFLAEIASTASSAILFYTGVEPLHALAFKAPLSAATNFLGLYYFSSKTTFGRPKLGTKFSAIKPLLSFSAYQFGFNFINYFSRNLDTILVGKYLGATSLGMYDKAYQLMRYPLMLLSFAMTPAIQPVIRKYADNKEEVESIHRDFTFKLSLIGTIVGVAIFSLSEVIVYSLLGAQWEEVVPLIEILAVAIPVQTVLSTSGSFYQAMNRADLLFVSGALSAVVMVGAIFWGIFERSMMVLSWSLVFAFHINFFQAYYILYSRVLRQGMYAFFIRMIPMFVAVAILAYYSLNFERLAD